MDNYRRRLLNNNKYLTAIKEYSFSDDLSELSVHSVFPNLKPYENHFVNIWIVGKGGNGGIAGDNWGLYKGGSGGAGANGGITRISNPFFNNKDLFKIENLDNSHTLFNKDFQIISVYNGGNGSNGKDAGAFNFNGDGGSGGTGTPSSFTDNNLGWFVSFDYFDPKAPDGVKGGRDGSIINPNELPEIKYKEYAKGGEGSPNGSIHYGKEGRVVIEARYKPYQWGQTIQEAWIDTGLAEKKTSGWGDSKFDYVQFKSNKAIGDFVVPEVTDLDLKTNLYSLFDGCNKLTSIDLSNWDTSNAKDLSYMFDFCDALKSINLNNFNTSSATNMSFMFSRCSSLETIDISNFDMLNVTDISGMFYETQLKSSDDIIGWSNLKLPNVTNINNLFEGVMYDGSYTYIDISPANNGKIVNMGSLFRNQSFLTNIKGIEDFDTSNVTNMYGVFGDCRSIESLDLSKWDTSKVTNMGCMFGVNPNQQAWSMKLKSINISNFNTSNVTDMSYMFNSCSYLKTLEVSHFDTSNVTDMSHMFSGCKSLEALDLSHFNTSNVTDMSYMFSECNSLKGILDISHFDISKVTDMSGMFWNSNYSSVDDIIGFRNLDFSNVTNIEGIFNNCPFEIEPDYSFILKSGNKIVNISNLYSGMLIYSVDMSNYDLTNVTNISYLFENCSNLNQINLGELIKCPLKTISCLFFDCSSLTDTDTQIIGLNNLDVSNVTSFLGCFRGCTNLTNINILNWDTSKVEVIANMFRDCSSLVNLDLSTFVTDSVKDLNYWSGEENGTFYGCTNLKTLKLNKWNLSKVPITKAKGLFGKCDSLIEITCTQAFKDWCIENQDVIMLPETMREGGSGQWIIV